MQTETIRKFLPLALIAAFCFAVILLLRFDPNQAGSPLPPCPFHWLTGLYCPGCGATRALHALLHGNVEKAFSMNPVFVIMLPALVLLIMHQIIKLPAGMAKTTAFFSDARPWAWLLISYAVLRNLPWYPFNLLAPG